MPPESPAELSSPPKPLTVPFPKSGSEKTEVPEPSSPPERHALSAAVRDAYSPFSETSSSKEEKQSISAGPNPASPVAQSRHCRTAADTCARSYCASFESDSAGFHYAASSGHPGPVSRNSHRGMKSWKSNPAPPVPGERTTWRRTHITNQIQNQWTKNFHACAAHAT